MHRSIFPTATRVARSSMTKLCYAGLVFSAFLSGCAAPGLPPYVTSRETLFHLQQLPEASIAVGTFSGGPVELSDAVNEIDFGLCRFEVGRQPDGSVWDYHDYMRDALAEEFAAAGRHADDFADVVIAAEVERLSLSRNLPFEGRWILDVRLTSSNGAELLASTIYRFDVVAFAGPTACNRAIENFRPAVARLFEEAARSPQFEGLLSKE